MIHLATLYELTDKYRRLLNLADELDEEVFKDTLESIDDELEDKIDGYITVDKKLQADEQMFADEIKRLQERKKSIATNRRNLKASLYDSMKLTGKEKVQTGRFSAWTQNNPPRLVVDDINKIPKAYWEEQEPKLNKRLLLEDLKGEEYPDFKGAHIEQSEGIRFR